jgi:hypothetical protein
MSQHEKGAILHSGKERWDRKWDIPELPLALTSYSWKLIDNIKSVSETGRRELGIIRERIGRTSILLELRYLGTGIYWIWLYRNMDIRIFC